MMKEYILNTSIFSATDTLKKGTRVKARIDGPYVTVIGPNEITIHSVAVDKLDNIGTLKDLT